MAGIKIINPVTKEVTLLEDETQKNLEAGFKGVMYAPFNANGDGYEAPVKMQGARNVEVAIESSDAVNYADDIAYLVIPGAESKTGTLTMFAFPRSYRAYALGYRVNSANGGESDTGVRRPHALQWISTQYLEDGTTRRILYILYSVTASKPGISKATKEGEVTGEDKQVPITLGTASFVTDDAGLNPSMYVIYENESNSKIFDLAEEEVILPTTIAELVASGSITINESTDTAISLSYVYDSNDEDISGSSITTYATSDLTTPIDELTPVIEGGGSYVVPDLESSMEYTIKLMQGTREVFSVEASTTSGA